MIAVAVRSSMVHRVEIICHEAKQGCIAGLNTSHGGIQFEALVLIQFSGQPSLLKAVLVKTKYHVIQKGKLNP